MCAIAGEVPPDVVYFDRFAIGEWAARRADGSSTADRKTGQADPNRVNLQDYYEYTVAEASFRPPGTNQTPGIFGVPISTDIRFMYCNGDVLRQCGLVDQKGEPQAAEELGRAARLREQDHAVSFARRQGQRHRASASRRIPGTVGCTCTPGKRAAR